MKIGILALQGAFREHALLLQQLGVETTLVKRRAELEGLDGIVIPGGESTTMGRLLRRYDLLEPLREMGQNGFPMFGTCAGMIVMAKDIEGQPEPHLGVMDVQVRRNSFGRQRDSFETDLDIPAIGAEPFRAVFIRAPHIAQVGPQCQVLCRYEDRIVAVQEDNLLALSFHPELTADGRLHQYFVNMVKQRKA